MVFNILSIERPHEGCKLKSKPLMGETKRSTHRDPLNNSPK